MNAAKTLIAALFLVAASLASVSQAAVINFNGTTGADGFSGYSYGAVLSTGGFNLSTPVYGFVAASTYDHNTDSGQYAFNDSDFFVSYAATNLFSATAQPFKITSIDLAVWTFPGANRKATLTGTKVGGGTVTQTFNLDTLPNGDKVTGNDFSTYFLVGFDNLSSLSISNNYQHYLAMDNLVMNENATSASAVPEPSSIALFGLALGAGAFARRRAVKAA